MSLTHRELEIERDLAADQPAAEMLAVVNKALARVAELEVAMRAINVIRDSIVGLQSFNFSEHAYPLVAALNAAGFEGKPYPESRENVGTMLERTNSAEARVAELEGQLESSRRDWKSCADSAIRRCDEALARVAVLETEAADVNAAHIADVELRCAETERADKAERRVTELETGSDLEDPLPWKR